MRQKMYEFDLSSLEIHCVESIASELWFFWERSAACRDAQTPGAFVALSRYTGSDASASGTRCPFLADIYISLV